MNFTASSFFASVIFSGIGLFAFTWGKKQHKHRLLVCGLFLMSYSFFVSNQWWNWGIGIGLSVLAYFLRQQNL